MIDLKITRNIGENGSAVFLLDNGSHVAVVASKHGT